MIKGRPVKLSNSGTSTLEECCFKYWLRYVMKAPEDDDYVYSGENAFIYGKLFHKIIEKKLRKRHYTFKDCLLSAIFDLLHEKRNKYTHGDYASNLNVAMASVHYDILMNDISKIIKLDNLTHTELRVESDFGIMILDAIYMTKNGDWLIGDWKTTGVSIDSKNDLIEARLHEDTQINQYAYYYEYVADMTGFDKDKFKGVFIAEFYKFQTRQTEYDTVETIISKIKNSKNFENSSRVLFVRKDDLDRQQFEDTFIDQYKEVLYYHSIKTYEEAEEKIRKNKKACTAIGRNRCAYWKICKGTSISKNNIKVKRLTCSLDEYIRKTETLFF